jgi:hypothetical protein
MGCQIAKNLLLSFCGAEPIMKEENDEEVLDADDGVDTQFCVGAGSGRGA